MPPHHWLRFGRSAQTAVGFFEDVASAGVDIVVHQYPAWTKAGYSLDEMKAMVQIPEVKCIKMGTREMSRWLFDYQELKKVNQDCLLKKLEKAILIWQYLPYLMN